MNTCQIIKNRRLELGLTLKDVANILGVAESTVSRYESSDIQNMGIDKISALAKALRLSPAELMGWEDCKHFYELETRSIPVLGRIACGSPIFAEEELSYIALQDVPEEADFALIARGDSMKNARINDGDYVFIKKQPTVKNGEIAAVLIDNEVTLKKFYFYPDKNKVVLYPDNPDYEPLVFIGEELNGLQVLGRAIAFQSTI